MSCSASQERQASAVSSIRSRDLGRGRRRRRRRSARPPPSAARTRRCSALGDGEGGVHDGLVVDVQRARPTTPPMRPDPNVRAPPSSSRISGRIRPYSGRGGELQRQLDLAGHALDAAQQLVRSVEAELVAALARGERHRVEQPDRARVGRERRLDDERAGEVAALGRVVARRAGSTSGQASGSSRRAKIAALS